MSEKRVEVKVFRVSLLCDRCGGEMEQRDTLSGGARQRIRGFLYQCGKCGFSGVIEKQYPYYVYEPVQAAGGIQRAPVESSMLASVGYDGREVLEVEFKNGAVWKYWPVSPFTYDALMNANSIGSFFINNVRDATGVQSERVL
ncbi:MAG: KTSC domain-containing protein [Acidobacteriota bacterium]|nr:KTSC domain-containing protein [Acidobacteriota bacterium]